MDDSYPSTNTGVSELLERDMAVAVIQKLGVPQYRTEHWKYTNPKPLIEELGQIPNLPSVPPTCVDGAVDILSFDSPLATEFVGKYVGSIAKWQHHFVAFAQSAKSNCWVRDSKHRCRRQRTDNKNPSKFGTLRENPHLGRRRSESQGY